MVASGLREFSWVSDSLNPALQVAYRIIGLGVLCSGAVALVLFASGALNYGQAAYIVVFASAGGLFLIVFSRRQYRGNLAVDDERLELRTPASTYSYPWDDVAYFIVRQHSSPATAHFLRLLRIPDSPFLEVHLTKRSRLGWRRSGTDMAGIPQVYRRLELRVDDFVGLVGYMSQHAQMRAA